MLGQPLSRGPSPVGRRVGLLSPFRLVPQRPDRRVRPDPSTPTLGGVSREALGAGISGVKADIPTNQRERAVNLMPPDSFRPGEEAPEQPKHEPTPASVGF